MKLSVTEAKLKRNLLDFLQPKSGSLAKNVTPLLFK